MDLTTRIRRRQQRGTDQPVIREYEAISPVAHVDEPVRRGPTLERLLDHLDPVFEGRLPANVSLSGPPGAGKSALITALFARLAELPPGSSAGIHTSTRAQTMPAAPAIVYVDTRLTDSPFGFYHALLDALVTESIPEQGLKTEALRRRVHELLHSADQQAVVAVDHVTEADRLDPSTLEDLVSPVEASLALVAVGRKPPGEIEEGLHCSEYIEIPAYRKNALVDVLAARSSDGLTQGVVGPEQFQRLAGWADGNAHDALAALFAAAHRVETTGRDQIEEEELTAGIAAVPQRSVALGRVHTLAQNRQLALRQLVDLPEPPLESVNSAADAIADSAGIELSAKTIERFLYELAEDGIIHRVPTSSSPGAGRPPSRLDPRFPVPVFRRLFDLDDT
jgi:Cdc6-like AAA superfamily ATPase